MMAEKLDLADVAAAWHRQHRLVQDQPREIDGLS
jgi:hypothetical protein